MIQTAISFLAAGAAQPQTPPIATDRVPAAVAPPMRDGRKRASRWFVRGGVADALYNSSARITTNGKIIPGSNAGVTDDTTVTVDIGFDLSDNVSVMFMAGIPPVANVFGQGSVAPFGELGRVRVGPAVLTAVYRLPPWHGLRPYVGAGGAHLFILKVEDGSVTQLKARDHNGFVLQAGAEYQLNRQWALYADYKHIWLNVHARGVLADAPVRATVTLNPDLISTGVKFRFN